jgi:hypothetical protein
MLYYIMISVDRAIGISIGLGVTFLSISGIMCVNSGKIATEVEDKSTCNNKQCSKVNMNLGLGSMCAAGGLMVYKNTLNF